MRRQGASLPGGEIFRFAWDDDALDRCARRAFWELRRVPGIIPAGAR